MTTAALKRPLTGIIPPMITPLTEHDVIDEPGVERLVEHILAGGVHGLFILGTCGEAPSLSHATRRRFMEQVCRCVNGRVPVLVGITDTSFGESINIANAAVEFGAQGLVLAPPYYFPAGQPELLEYVEHLVPRLPLPVFLYNLPSHTKMVFGTDTLLRAAQLPGVAGLKDSSGDMVYFHTVKALLADRPEFSLLVGPEELLAEVLLLGGHGGISGGANIHPKLYVDLYEAALRGDLAEVRRLHDQVIRVRLNIYNVGRHSSSVIKGIKCALSCLGICDDFMAEPLHRFRAPERRQIETHLVEMGLLDK